MKHILLLLLSLTFYQSSFAQSTSGTVNGKLNGPEGEALGFATVMLENAADSSLVKGGYTDESGTYVLGPVPAGEYHVKAQYVGMNTVYSPSFSLADGEEKTLELLTLGGGVEVDEVTIREEKPLIQVTPDRTIFNVSQSPSANGESALEVLRKAPGVIVDNNDNVILQGKSGVRVMIDGRPVPVTGGDLAAMLRVIPSNQIESIEIITNPGAQFDAEGNAGIINIKMKKEEAKGFNGNVDLGFAQGIYPKYNGSGSLNYRNKRFNAYGSAGYNDAVRENFQNFYRITEGVFYDTRSTSTTDMQSFNYKGGMDIYLGKKSTLGIMSQGYLSGSTWENDTRTGIGIEGNNYEDVYLLANTVVDNGSDNVNFNLNYRFDDGNNQTFTINADYGFFNQDNFNNQPNSYYDTTGAIVGEANYQTNAPTDIDIYSFKADYERPLAGGKLSAGGKAGYVKTHNVFMFYDVLGGENILNEDRSNTFDYTENVNALYANYSRPFGKFNVTAGLRAEHTYSLGDLQAATSTGIDRVERNYLNLFPSGGVTWQINQKNMSRVNYSRRIDRPRYQNLNPFEFKLDELTYQRGNPFLQPQYTHSIEIGHTYMYTLNFSLGYSITNDFMSQIVDTTETSATFLTQQNMDSREVISFNASYPRQITKWWSTFTNFTAYHARNKGDFGEGKEIDLTATSFNVFHQSSFNLPAGIMLQLQGFYSSPGIWGGNFRTKGMGGVEAGVSRRFFKERANLKLAVSDIFQTMRWGGEQEYGGLVMTANGGWESRLFKVNFNYTFGNQKLKSKKRDTGIEEERGRIEGGGNGGGMGGQ